MSKTLRPRFFVLQTETANIFEHAAVRIIRRCLRCERSTPAIFHFEREYFQRREFRMLRRPTSIWTPRRSLPRPNAVSYTHLDVYKRQHVLIPALRGDVAFIKAWKGDRWGNLVYRKTARNLSLIHI